LPFVLLYSTDDEWVLETANQTVHGDAFMSVLRSYDTALNTCLYKQAYRIVPSSKYSASVTEIAPLTPQEEAAWRALARAVLVIPRVLDAELLESQGLNLTEYNVLMNLSEAPDHSLRMSELANFISITISGLTRAVERLSRQGLVERVRAESDGRGQVAVLTPAGLTRLKQAWPIHLAGVRRHVMDHLEGMDLVAFAEAIAEVASADVGPPVRRTTPRAERATRR
jgi:DNA-binding MarR family transcriptional regulator